MGKPRRVAAGILAALTLALLFPAFHWLIVTNWLPAPGSSIGLIPLATGIGWVTWEWRRLPNRSPARPAGAIALLAAGLWWWLAAWAAEASVFQGNALPLLLGGLVWLYGGEPKLKRLIFPLAYLWLVFPPPGLVEHWLGFPLRLWSARLAYVFITILGLPGQLQGTSIVGPNLSFDVAPACSGLRTVYVFLVAGVLVARLMHRQRHWFALQIATIPLATLLANSLRITSIAWIGHHFGLNTAMGLAHETAGLVFFVIVFGVFMALGLRLSRNDAVEMGSATVPVAPGGVPPTGPLPPPGPPNGVFRQGGEVSGGTPKTAGETPRAPQGTASLPLSRKSAIAPRPSIPETAPVTGAATPGLDTGPRRLLLAWHASLLVITALFIVAIRNNQLLVPAFNPPPLSYSFEGWAGQDAPLTAVEADLFGTERLVKRVYGRDDQIVELIISTSLPERRSLHDPAGCYVAAGGRVLERWTTRLPGADGAAAVEVGELLVAGPDTAGKGERLRCRFWFVREDGRTLGRGYDLILSTMWDRLRLRPQRQWRLFSLATAVQAGEEARGGRTLEAFTDALRRAAATRPTPRSKAAS